MPGILRPCQLPITIECFMINKLGKGHPTIYQDEAKIASRRGKPKSYIKKDGELVDKIYHRMLGHLSYYGEVSSCYRLHEESGHAKS